jgi:flagellar hook-basal body complex protein FliE
MDIKAQSLYGEMQAMALQTRTELVPNENLQVNPTQANFSEMLSNAIDGVNSMQLHSKEQAQKFEMGDPSLSLADVMVAKEKAGIAFEATMQVRNKVLEAYKQVMNMPV